jgi:hypothetical protein
MDEFVEANAPLPSLKYILNQNIKSLIGKMKLHFTASTFTK